MILRRGSYSELVGNNIECGTRPRLRGHAVTGGDAPRLAVLRHDKAGTPRPVAKDQPTDLASLAERTLSIRPDAPIWHEDSSGMLDDLHRKVERLEALQRTAEKKADTLRAMYDDLQSSSAIDTIRAST